MREENPMIRGSCLCGAIRYEADAQPLAAWCCHCQRCRKARGSAFAPNLFVPIDSLRFVAGEEHIRSYKVPEAERFTHVFCEHCGSSLPFRNVARGVAVIPMGSLDDDPGLAPQAHIFVGSKASWHAIRDDLPQYEAYVTAPSPSPSPS